jgi:hypothetical protein
MIEGDDELAIQLIDREHGKQGNVMNISDLVREIAKYGNIAVFTHLIHLYPDSWKMSHCAGWFLSIFAHHSRIEMFEWMIGKCKHPFVSLLRRYIVCYIVWHDIGDVNMLNCLGRHGCWPTEMSVCCGVSCGNVIFCKWCFEHGYTKIPKLMHDLKPSVPYTREMLDLLHHYHVPGVYQSVCNTGMCNVCRCKSMANLWEMDSATFTSYIQWLPNEMLVEIGEVM